MWGNTALIVACQYSHTDIAEYLLNIPNINIHAKNDKGISALVYASIEGMNTVVRALFVKNAHIEYTPVKLYSSVLDRVIECTYAPTLYALFYIYTYLYTYIYVYIFIHICVCKYAFINVIIIVTIHTHHIIHIKNEKTQ